MRSRDRSRQDGFSFIEVLVAIVILAIVAGGIAQGLSQASNALGKSRSETVATKVCSAKIDQVQRLRYEDIGLVGGSPPGVLAGTTASVVGGTTYRVVTAVDYVDDPALGQPQTFVNYKRVRVTVTPQDAAGRACTQTTIVTPPSIGSVAGKATIIARLIDAVTDEAIAGAPVTADLSTSPTQTKETDATGTVVFAGLEPSAIPTNDPEYRYRLTVGLPAPWVTAADSQPSVAQQHLSASQTWETTLRVFKRATIIANLRDADTGLPISEYSKVTVTTPAPENLSGSQQGTGGGYTFSQIAGRDIVPSRSNFRVVAEADCYESQTIDRPVPVGYPSSTTETFTFSMRRVASGTIRATVRSTASGNPVIPGAQVQVSGGQSNVPPTVRTTDSSGVASFCLPPSGSTSYIVSATAPGFGAGSLLAAILAGAQSPSDIRLVPSITTGDIRLQAPGSDRLVRLRALLGTYDATRVTNQFAQADFAGLATGVYRASIATGFANGVPIFGPEKAVSAVAGVRTTYTVP